MTITVLLADSNQLFRSGFLHLLQAQDDIDVVDETGDVYAARDLVLALAPKVLVMGVASSHADSIDIIRQVVSASPQINVVALPDQLEDGQVDQVLRAGARGCLPKESASEEFLDAVRTVVNGDVYISASLIGGVVSSYADLLSENADSAAASDAVASPLLLTKLHRPVIPAEMVRRGYLLQRLTDGSWQPLTVVTAPAGYGKSTLISQWLAEGDCPDAWLSLDEHDDDLHIFLMYFIAALQTMFPNSFSKTSALLGALKLPPLRVLVSTLVNELTQIDGPCTLVLDDYHTIQDEAIHAFLDELLRYLPSELRLILITRREPNLTLPTMRARRQVLDISYQDLRFDAKETAAFLQLKFGRPVADDVPGAFADKMEGWITGIHLATLQMCQVSLGVNRYLSDEPHWQTILLDAPLRLAGREHRELGIQHYCFDPSLAPPGKSAIELFVRTSYAYWQRIYGRRLYDTEQTQISDLIIERLEARYPGIGSDIEFMDEATPMSYERCTGNWMGATCGWLLTKETVPMMIRGVSKTLPGLDNFYMAGHWVEPGGTVALAVASGRTVMQLICARDDIICRQC